MKVKFMRSSPKDIRVPEDVLQLKGRDIPFVNNVTYLGVTFDWRMTQRLHIERTADKVMRTYMAIYSLFRSERYLQILNLRFTKL
jgi:hypothetical protein